MSDIFFNPLKQPCDEHASVFLHEHLVGIKDRNPLNIRADDLKSLIEKLLKRVQGSSENIEDQPVAMSRWKRNKDGKGVYKVTHYNVKHCSYQAHSPGIASFIIEDGAFVQYLCRTRPDGVIQFLERRKIYPC